MKYKKEDLIDAVVKMRVEKMASNKTILEFLKNEIGYKQTYAYEILKEAREKIREIYKLENTAHLEEAIGQLEEMAEDAKKSKNYKLAFEIRKELSKISGHYTEKIELNGQIDHKVTIIKLNGPEDNK
jgi:activator of 2-hydroxyglutaryl-CoA dehydratase